MTRISEVFYSIQGEGIYQGLPTLFIRFQGCNLLTHCTYCDTGYAQDPNDGTDMAAEAIVSVCVRLQPRTYQTWICITGGEPLYQPDDLYELVRKLKAFGYRVEIETNGSIKPPKWYTIVDSWCTDIKCPSSGVCGISLEEWFNTRFCDQIKFVVGNKEDLDFARKLTMKNAARSPQILVSPVVDNTHTDDKVGGQVLLEKLWLQEVVEFCKDLEVRFSLQWHKVVYGNRRGV